MDGLARRNTEGWHAGTDLWILLGCILAFQTNLPIKAAEQEIEFLRVPDNGVQPRAVAEKSGRIHLVYLRLNNAGGDIYYTVREPGAGGWSDPIRVNSEAGSVKSFGAIGRAELALGKNARPHITWFNMGARAFWYTRLADDGRSFEPQRDLVSENDGGVEASASIAADGEGNVFIVWHAGPFASEERRAVFLRHSADEGLTFSEERRAGNVEDGACGCCGLAAHADDAGRLLILYRAAGEGVHRDMTLLVSEDRGRTFSARTIDRWTLNACPVTTTALATGASETLLSWVTEGRVFVEGAAGHFKRAAAPGLPATGRQKDLALAADKGGYTLLVWVIGADWRLGGELRYQLFSPTGEAAGRPGRPADRVPDNSFPTVVSVGEKRFVVLY